VTSPAKGRIAYILKMFPRFSETFILSEILELERAGVDIHIFSLKTPQDGPIHADVQKVKAPITYVPVTRLADGLEMFAAHWQVLRWHPLNYLKIVVRTAARRRWGAVKRFLQAGAIAPRLKHEGITHVHAHFGSSAASVAYYLHHLMGMSYSFTAHAKDIYIDSVSQDVLKRKMQHARFVVTVSDFNQAHLAALVPDAPITRIYNGLDLHQFSRNGTHPDTPPLILAVGRLVEKKGFADLIRACSMLRDKHIDFRCRIVGTGDEEPRLRALIQALALAGVVELVGPMPREDLIALYPQARVVVAPCVVAADGNRDGLPTVLIEAMALEVPVVSTPVTGIPEIVRHGETGLLVPPHDPAGLAIAIECVLHDRARSLAMARAGRACVEQHFEIRKNITQLRELFEKASAPV
jgi:colanic acid/amylovoran biosynthesis glycosyltransferase